MLRSIFVDTNVLLDCLAMRQGFAEDAKAIWILAERGEVSAYVSAISFNNVYYFLRKIIGHGSAMDALSRLRTVFTPVALDENVLAQAIRTPMADFEDAIQYFSAIRAEAQCVITRNAGHFPKSEDMPVVTPPEFLAQW